MSTYIVDLLYNTIKGMSSGTFSIYTIVDNIINSYDTSMVRPKINDDYHFEDNTNIPIKIYSKCIHLAVTCKFIKNTLKHIDSSNINGIHEYENLIDNAIVTMYNLINMIALINSIYAMYISSAFTSIFNDLHSIYSSYKTSYVRHQ